MSSLHQDAEHYPLLPAQYDELTRRCASMEPERRLLLAILSDAIVIFQARGASPCGAKRRAFDEAARWLLSEDRAWACSFVNVCEALGIAHRPLRRALLAWHQRTDSQSVRAARRRLLAGKDVRQAAVG
jgi:hypothetical protein